MLGTHATRATADSIVTSPTNYCGLYSVYGASVALGKPIAFQSLLDRKYLSCPSGSSVRELETAVTDNGLYALTLSNMMPAALGRIASPMILYVRSSIASRNYDHYILYLGKSGGKYRCVDAAGTSDWSEAELLTQWSGAGIMVTAAPVSAVSVLWRDWAGGGALLAGLIVVPLGLRSAWRRWGRDGGASLPVPTGCVIFLTVVFVASTLYHRVSAAGLLADGNVTATVADAYPAQFMPKRSEAAAYAAWHAGRALFVDARVPEAYAAGHVAGALNLYVHAPSANRRALLKDTARDRPLIVYCQNDQCPYATVLAARLIADGFVDVTIYRQGWDGWRDNPDRRVAHE